MFISCSTDFTPIHLIIGGGYVSEFHIRASLANKFKRIMFSFLYSPLKLVNPTYIDLIHSDIENLINKDKKVVKKYDEINLTDIESPISIFRIFIRQKILFISPIPKIICTFAPFLLILLPKYSNISYILRKYCQLNNSIRY